jgi:hypothetical protein
MDKAYYSDRLYPLQDTVLGIFGKLGLPFYLTGGTALSRHYLGHRYSDDLDLFVNSHPEFRALVGQAEEGLRSQDIAYQDLVRGADFVRIEIVESPGTRLMVDLVNDQVLHFGGFEQSPVLGRVDNVPNILSNKLSAISRLEIKDFADVVCIARSFSFGWEEIVDQAFQKDAWINPIDLARYFATVDGNLFSAIRWVRPLDPLSLKSNCLKISDDILKGNENSLYSPSPQGS